MTTVELLFVTVPLMLLALGVFVYFWFRRDQPPQEFPLHHLYCCPYLERQEFMGGYRDPVDGRQDAKPVQCTYTVSLDLKGEATPLCPIHKLELVRGSTARGKWEPGDVVELTTGVSGKSGHYDKGERFEVYNVMKGNVLAVSLLPHCHEHTVFPASWVKRIS